ncbi:MAG: methyltransferase [Lysobacteraceae bacterium]|nr:MAG: methyltransferase [Xanthomonadaceae bacterium]
MSVIDSETYILGTERAELFRLGLQHQVWAEEARTGWRHAGFGAGDKLLDLGCGPGFCTQDLGYIVGPAGRVIAVDRSQAFIEFCRQSSTLHGLPVDCIASTFDDMKLADGDLDGAYCRWALAWVANPEAVLGKVAAALRPGGTFVCHEYFDWKTFQTEPAHPELDSAIAAALQSFKQSAGDIDIGRRLPALFGQAGLEVVSTRPMTKLVRPGDFAWQWPASFFEVYFPKVVDAGLMSAETCQTALAQWKALEQTAGASCMCPQMIEVIGRRL